MSFASPILTATLRAKDETGNTLKGIVRGFTRAFTDIAKVAAGILLRDVTRAMVGIGKESITLGAKIETLQNSFTALKGDTDESVLSLDTLRTAVDATVSDVDLLTAANQALALGLPVDQLNDLFAAARKVGGAMGRTTLQSVQDLTTGIGRQSRLILDNLGIIVDAETAYEEYALSIGKASSELTLQERKTAFTNAAITQLNSKAEILGDNISNITTLNEQFNTSLTNLKTEIGTFLIPIVSDLVKQFTDDWLPSIQNIVEMFRSRDFTGIGELIKDTFRKAINRVVAFLDGIDWDSVWTSIVDIAVGVFNDLSGRVKNIIDSINWTEVWDSLTTFAGTLWGLVKEKLIGWGDRFKEDVLPQDDAAWAAAWGTLMDFAGKLWDEYFIPALKEILPIIEAWLPQNTQDWADIWTGLWAFAGEMWDTLLGKSGDVATEFATFIKDTNWEPLITALDETIGEAIRGVIKAAWSKAIETLPLISGLGSFGGGAALSLQELIEKLKPADPMTEPGVTGAERIATGFIPPQTSGADRSNVGVTINIANFIGLDEASTRKQLANVIASIDIVELQRRGVR